VDLVQAAPPGIAVRCGNYFAYPATTPGMPIDWRGKVLTPDCIAGAPTASSAGACTAADACCVRFAGYTGYSSIAYETDLWNTRTVYPDTDALQKVDKATLPQAILGSNQFIQHQIEAQVHIAALSTFAFMATRCVHRLEQLWDYMSNSGFGLPLAVQWVSGCDADSALLLQDGTAAAG
jgi:hypothetical protein